MDAAEAATALFNHGEKILGTDESTFIAAYGCFNHEQLAKIAELYPDISGGATLEDAIDSEGFTDDFCALAKSLQTSPIDLICTQIMNRFEAPPGTVSQLSKMASQAMRADWRIIRAIGGMPKATGDEIAGRYEQMSGVSLAGMCEEHLSGKLDLHNLCLDWRLS